MAEYGSMFIVSGLAAILFFGGWHGPIPVMSILGDSFGWSTESGYWWYVSSLVGCANFIGKASTGVIVMIWIRWTLPRLRIDQVITMCWKYCVPISAVCFLIVLGWQYAGLPSANDIAPGVPRSEVREGWVSQLNAAEPVVEASAVASPDAGGGI